MRQTRSDVNVEEGDLYIINHTDEEPAEFDPTLWMALADSWWELGRKLSPFAGDALTAEQKAALVAAWVAGVRSGAEDDDEDLKAAVTPEALTTFIDNALRLLERKYKGEPIAAELQTLVDGARYRISDDGTRLSFHETPEAFWAWEYVYLFEDLKYDDPGWETAVGYCDGCRAFFVKSRKDQRFHADACRKKAANKRFYKTRGKSKRRRVVRTTVPSMQSVVISKKNG